MQKVKFVNILLLLAILFSFTGGGTLRVTAQAPQPPTIDGTAVDQEPLSQADRQAAADRAADGGFTVNEIGGTDMTMPGDAPRYFSVPNYANSPLPALVNPVIAWNELAQQIVQPAPMPGMPMSSGPSMATAFVYLSYLQAAVYDALVSIEGGYELYNTSLQAADPTASRDAAVAEAAYRVLLAFLARFPNVDQAALLNSRYTAALAAIPDGAQKTAGIQAGFNAATGILALRATDGLLASNTYTLLPPGPGVWEPTVVGTMVIPPIDPWMAQLTPFTLTSPSQFRPGAPWDLSSAQWAAELNAVKAIGGTTSTTRTAEQTFVARFWTTNNVIQFNSAYREIAASQQLNLLETARLMAMGNVVGTDALVACFDAKYTYSFWRPITAIQRADTDGTTATVADPTWTPLVTTPSFPEYVAGHSCYVSAQAEVISAVLGTQQIELDLNSLITGTSRHYATTAELRQEVNNARVWAGLHYPTSTTLGQSLGQSVAQYALQNYFLPAADLSAHADYSWAGGIRKFVDTLPGVTPAGANNLGQYIPVAVADTTTYPGSDYYEIAVVEYEEQMHSDLPPTLLRGYVQLDTDVIPGAGVLLTNPNGSPILLPDGTQARGVDNPHYLGPYIQATSDRPVRVLFRNLLPTGVDGNLFIPVDTTVMGAGMGPLADMAMDTDPLNPMCDDVAVMPDDCYTENRATLHLHGGITPWISDGTPHQWTTPAGENTAYPEGVSVQNVPDMPDPGPGAITFFYTNQQSARLMFYHDHSWGITRLNVYAGEAAAYSITDPAEQALITDGIIPATQIPLIIQDKTFVPSDEQLSVSDPLWDTARWGDYGDLWMPHVYVPAQNPGDSSGVNQFGRWAYGPWFWPPTSSIDNPPVANPYYDPNCNPDVQWCEPPLMPGTPYNSMGMEAFNDTPVVNGTLYPSLTVDPESIRFRILNAANDRFFNLSLYIAVDANGQPCTPRNPGDPALVAESTGELCTEVRLNDVLAALDDPTIFPTPDQTLAGPDWIQIGTEGGFLPAPAIIPAHPTTWVNDPTVFNAGNVDLHSLLLGPAERADVIVDFAAFAGYTLILYNDAPAAFPARDPRYDYYTGNGDYRDTGGAPSTEAGYGPNTRTVMRIIVNPVAQGETPAAAFDLPRLQAAFAHHLDGSGNPAGVFETSQNPIIVGQGAYNSAYGTSFQNNGPYAGLVQIFDASFTFNTLSGNQLTMELERKAIQDEMGEAFDPEYGRMSGSFGVEVPNTQAGTQQNLILYPYVNPATEILDGIELPAGVMVTPISTGTDGTQIWKITHNGVDTHPVHFHLFDVQLINRVGWDGIIRKPDANELGWKDTVRISPLEDTIVALRPIIPAIPFGVPESIRPLNPMMPIGSTEGFNSTDIFGNPINPPITNQLVNFGWEYVIHCHILSHEEMDMMRPVIVNVETLAPEIPVVSFVVAAVNAANANVLTWTDGTPVDYNDITTWGSPTNEIGFRIERAEIVNGQVGTYTTIGTALANQTSFVDLTAVAGVNYSYRVAARNAATEVFSSPITDTPVVAPDYQIFIPLVIR